LPNQRDFIVGMIRVAMEENLITLNSTSAINCPENHNKKKENVVKTKFKRSKNSLDLKVIMDDFVLPTKTIKQGIAKKKNKTIGSASRYLLLGTNQLIIAR
jgi:tyrosine-protein phosphatase YwqE